MVGKIRFRHVILYFTVFVFFTSQLGPVIGSPAGQSGTEHLITSGSERIGEVLEIRLDQETLNADGSVSADVTLVSKASIFYGLSVTQNPTGSMNGLDQTLLDTSLYLSPRVEQPLGNITFHPGSRLRFSVMKYGHTPNDNSALLAWDVVTAFLLFTGKGYPPAFPTGEWARLGESVFALVPHVAAKLVVLKAQADRHDQDAVLDTLTKLISEDPRLFANFVVENLGITISEDLIQKAAMGVRYVLGFNRLASPVQALLMWPGDEYIELSLPATYGSSENIAEEIVGVWVSCEEANPGRVEFSSTGWVAFEFQDTGNGAWSWYGDYSFNAPQQMVFDGRSRSEAMPGNVWNDRDFESHVELTDDRLILTNETYVPSCYVRVDHANVCHSMHLLVSGRCGNNQAITILFSDEIVIEDEKRVMANVSIKANKRVAFALYFEQQGGISPDFSTIKQTLLGFVPLIPDHTYNLGTIIFPRGSSLTIKQDKWGSTRLDTLKMYVINSALVWLKLAGIAPTLGDEFTEGTLLDWVAALPLGGIIDDYLRAINPEINPNVQPGATLDTILAGVEYMRTDETATPEPEMLRYWFNTITGVPGLKEAVAAAASALIVDQVPAAAVGTLVDTIKLAWGVALAGETLYRWITTPSYYETTISFP